MLVINITYLLIYAFVTANVNANSEVSDQTLRSGQRVLSYNVNITANEDGFDGRAIIRIDIYNPATRGETIKLHFDDLVLHSVHFGLSNLNRPQLINDVTTNDGILLIDPPIASSIYMFDIVYSGKIRNNGVGIYKGSYEEGYYLAMNLYPTHARKVFPCMDELTVAAELTMTFNHNYHNNIVGNSINRGTTNRAEFLPIHLPSNLWGLIAHDLVQIVLPNPNVELYARLFNQNTYASFLIPTIFNYLTEWTNTNYFEIVDGQEEKLRIFALPDVTRDWQALSTIGIWEPYILAHGNTSLNQRLNILIAIAEGFTKQWFGFVTYPQNWKYAWINAGLAVHVAYEAAAEADTDIDVNSIFLTDVIQESMLRDSFTNAQILEPEDFIFRERDIKNHLNGILKYKAPALMRMLKLILNLDDTDVLKFAAFVLLEHRALRHHNSFHFYDAINSFWFFLDDPIIEDVPEFIKQYIHNTGYPILNVEFRHGGLRLTQERFGFREVVQINYDIPLTYTCNTNLEFDNTQPFMVLKNDDVLFYIDLGVDDWVVFNIQGQGYYRVNYDLRLWNSLIKALNNETTRESIHPLNRAALVDDVFNLARAGKQDYDVALRLALTMELELEYAPWKTFIRNMEFLRKQLNAYIQENDLESDVYKMLVDNTFTRFENEYGFYPDEFIIEYPMIPRGLIMEYACLANAVSCLEVANDMFYEYEGNDTVVINTAIHPEVRPAVFCTVVREDKEDVVDTLWQLYNDEESHYERIVILKSFACSLDGDFIWKLLEDTLSDDSLFGVEERVIFYEAVAESHLDNAVLALRFIRLHINEIREKYGGSQSLDRIIYTLTDNLVTKELVELFETWLEAINTDLGDSEYAARQGLSKAKDNLYWREHYVTEVYTWIKDNLYES